LHDILGFRCTSEHAVSDAEQTRTHGGKSRKAIVVFAALYLKAKGRMGLW
jgi:hypothetical protein